MTFSLIRGLTASVLSNVSSLKRQSKRLHKHASDVFGRPVTIEQCQEAVAKANGFFKWSDVMELSGKFSNDKSNPFWTINTRNNLHESVLSALLHVDMDLNYNHPLIITGNGDSTLVGTTLWLESISVRKEPGLILIDTDKETFEDTDIGKAVISIDKDEEFSRFRVIDARQINIPVSISTTVDEWVRAVADILPKEDRDSFEESGGNHLLRAVSSAYASSFYHRNNNYEDVSFHHIERAVRLIKSPEHYKDALLIEIESKSSINIESLEADIRRYGDRVSKEVLDRVFHIIKQTDQCNFELGPVIWEESKHTPTIVLFSNKSKESEIIASAIHSMYFSRYVMARGIRPILYFSDSEQAYIPNMLKSGANTIIVDNSISTMVTDNDSYQKKHALIASTDSENLTFLGRKAKITQS